MRLIAIVATAAVLAACTSPEAQRVRGGGAGADVGNRRMLVRMHGGSRMYAGTPCLLPRTECPGPLPASGLPGVFPASRRTRR